MVALGLVDLLSRRVSRVGFFRPVVESVPDNDVELIRARYDLPEDRVGVALTADQVGETGGGGLGSERALADVLAAHRRIAANCDMVVIEGSDFTGASSPLEFGLNARLATNLGAPVLGVVEGNGRTLPEILEGVRISEESLRSRGLSVLALVVNRVDLVAVDELDRALAGRSADAPPVWAIPEMAALRQPSLAELGEALGAELVAGSSQDLDREVRSVKVAAMTVPNVLDHVEEGTVFIAPGDRADLVVAAALTRQSAAYPSVAGVILSGELAPDPRVTQLIDAAGDRRSPMPMMMVRTDTFDTAIAAGHVEGAITPGNVRKIEAGLGLFATHVDGHRLEQRIELARSTVVTPVMFQYDLIERARAAGAHIVLPEGTDDRILDAADRLVRRRVCELTILGPEADVRQRISELGLDLADRTDVTLVDPLESSLLDGFAETYHRLREHKGMTAQKARDIMTDGSFFGTMMVHEGLVDGMVSGAAHTTAHTIRPALEFVKTRPDTSIVSSVFLMLLADRVLVYGDCAVNPDPDAEQLADIAVSSAETAALFGIEPRVAMLSYSTGASGSGADVDKVRVATERVRELRPDLPVEGPIQYDAAIDVNVGRAKLPGSEVAGQATVFVFPDLNTGNNTYKAVQRSAGAVAVGPVLQGLKRPVNDLSRGATVTDIVNTVAITAIQAGSLRPDAGR